MENSKAKYLEFQDSYTLYLRYVFDNQKYSLGKNSSRTRICRFCDLDDSKVTFKKIAHAIPEFLENRGVISLFECDECNDFFARTCENQLGNYSLFYRSLFNSSGKRGKVKLKKHDRKIFPDTTKDNFIVITKHIDSPNLAVDIKLNEISIKNKSGKFIPIEVYKAFIKIFITLIKDSDLEKVEFYKKLITRIPSASKITQGAYVYEAFTLVSKKTRVDIFKRKEKYDFLLPYAKERPLYVMNLYYKYLIFQIPIYDIERIEKYGVRINNDLLPVNLDDDFELNTPIEWILKDWCKTDEIDVEQTINMSYKECIEDRNIKEMAKSYISE